MLMTQLPFNYMTQLAVKCRERERSLCLYCIHISSRTFRAYDAILVLETAKGRVIFSIDLTVECGLKRTLTDSGQGVIFTKRSY